MELFTDFVEHKVDAICAAFSNLLSRATSKMPKEWNLRFAQIMQRSMLSQFLEARNLFHKKSPSISTYMSQRSEFGYMDIALVCNDHLARNSMLKSKYFTLNLHQLIHSINSLSNLLSHIRLNCANEFNVNFILFNVSSAKTMKDVKVVQMIELVQ